MESLLRKYGQGHLFDDQEQLSPGSKGKQEIMQEKINFPLLLERLQASYELSLKSNQNINPFSGSVQDLSSIDVASEVSACMPDQNKNVVISDDSIGQLFLSGLERISKGESAVVQLAGGQGSRQGFNHPKAMFPLGEAGDSILECHVVKILALQHAAKRAFPTSTPVIPLLIMTSAATHDETVAFCHKTSFYGLNPEQVFFIEQSTQPVVTYTDTDKNDSALNVLHQNNGRTVRANLVLDDQYHLAQSPNGNGGVYLAIHENLDRVSAAFPNIKFWHLIGVDNILMKLSDPVMLGQMHRDASLNMCIKSVKKRNAQEKVGVIAMRRGKYAVVEYSEMAARANDVSEDGEQQFQDSNIVSLMFTDQFLKKCIDKRDLLPYHIAENKHIQSHNCSQPCTKLEQFNFDVMEIADNIALVRSRREVEFAPIKNEDSAGVDCPKTAILAYTEYYRNIGLIKAPAAPLRDLVRSTFMGE